MGRKQEREATHIGQALSAISPPATYRAAPMGNLKKVPPVGDRLLPHVGLRDHFIRTTHIRRGSPVSKCTWACDCRG